MSVKLRCKKIEAFKDFWDKDHVSTIFLTHLIFPCLLICKSWQWARFAAAHDGELFKPSSCVLERYTNMNVTVSDFAEIRKQPASTRSLHGNKMTAKSVFYVICITCCACKLSLQVKLHSKIAWISKGYTVNCHWVLSYKNYPRLEGLYELWLASKDTMGNSRTWNIY